jgi:hypothetical protein
MEMNQISIHSFVCFCVLRRILFVITVCYSQLAQLNQLLSSRQSGGTGSEPRIKRVWPSEAHVHEDHSDDVEQTNPEIGKAIYSIQYVLPPSFTNVKIIVHEV